MDQEKRQLAWWYYFWFIALLTAISPFFGPFDPADWAYLVFDVIGLIGLWAYLRQRPIISRHFWAAYFLVAIAVTAYYSIAFFAETAEFGGLFIGLGAVALAAAIPLFLALWRYAFRSSAIWGGAGAA